MDGDSSRVLSVWSDTCPLRWHVDVTIVLLRIKSFPAISLLSSSLRMQESSKPVLRSPSPNNCIIRGSCHLRSDIWPYAAAWEGLRSQQPIFQRINAFPVVSALTFSVLMQGNSIHRCINLSTRKMHNRNFIFLFKMASVSRFQRSVELTMMVSGWGSKYNFMPSMINEFLIREADEVSYVWIGILRFNLSPCIVGKKLWSKFLRAEWLRYTGSI